MKNCNVNVWYVRPGILEEVAVITFDGDIETLPGEQRGVIEAAPETLICMQAHDAVFVADKPLVWKSHEGSLPSWIEVRLDSPRELKLIVGDIAEREVAKFVVNLETEDGVFTSKDPTVVNDPVNMPPTGGR
jgi:hypothetical protein